MSNTRREPVQAVKAGWLIISADDVREACGFLIEDGRVSALLPNAAIDRLDGVEVADRSDSVVCPGFVNTHMHAYGVMSHGMTPNIPILDFNAFLADYWWPDLENKLRLEHVLTTARHAARESIESGVVAICDILEAPYCEEGSLIEQGNELAAFGIRAIVSLESSERLGRANGDRCLAENVRAVRHFKASPGKVNGAICTHTTFTCSDDFIANAAAMAKAEGAMLQFHLSESRYEPDVLAAARGAAPTDVYRRLGALGDKTLASQCVKVTPDEIGWLRETNTYASHMPISNCEVGGGVAPVPDMLAAGIKVGLGSDGYINDFFAVMRAAFLIHKAHRESTTTMPAKTVFRMATEYGAACLQYNGGTLEPGCPADYLVLDNAWPTPLTAENIFDQIVVYGKKEFVRRVFVEGRCIYDREIGFGTAATADRAAVLRQSRALWQSQRQ